MEIEIAPTELKQRLDAGEKLAIVDVREAWEQEICAIPGAKVMPMSTLPANSKSLEGANEVILYCHHGVRSLNAAAWLRQHGVPAARSLAGGIDRWAAEVDPTIARY